MIDKENLKQSLIAIFIVCLLDVAFFGNTPVTNAFITSWIFLIAIYHSIKPRTIEITANRLFKDNFETNRLHNSYKSDEQFRSAIDYAVSLTPDDFLTFSRMCVEIRDQMSQNALKEVADYFRRIRK